MIQLNTDTSNEFDALAVDLTPMLDILFIVLVFFILTANPALHALKVDLPSKGAEQADVVTTPKQVHLTLFAKQQWAVNQQIFTDWKKTQQAFSHAVHNKPDIEIIIATEKNASVERFLEIMSFLKQKNLQVAHIRMDAMPH